MKKLFLFIIFLKSFNFCAIDFLNYKLISNNGLLSYSVLLCSQIFFKCYFKINGNFDHSKQIFYFNDGKYATYAHFKKDADEYNPMTIKIFNSHKEQLYQTKVTPEAGFNHESDKILLLFSYDFRFLIVRYPKNLFIYRLVSISINK